MLLASKFFWLDKSIFAFEKQNIFFDEKPKMTKEFEFEKLKIPNPDIWPFWEFFNFSNSIFFVVFGFLLKNIFFLKVNILLSYQKNFEVDSINREEDIL